MSDFVSRYTGFSGPTAAQADIDAASHNVANTSTVVHTRQHLDLSSRNQIETAIARSAHDMVTITRQLFSLEDIEIAEAVMELQLQQTAYEAALAALSVSSQASLVDFLR